MQDIKAIIDIGNATIKGVVIGQDEQKTTVLVKKQVMTKGIRKGNILDKNELAGVIQEVIDTFHKKLGGDYIDEYIIWLSHPFMLIQRVQEQKRVMTDDITKEDVQHLSHVIADVANSIDGYETLKITPIHRVIDETKTVKEPIGLKAKKLDMAAYIFLIPQNCYNDLIEVIDMMGIYIQDIIPNALATPEVTLDYDAKDLGVITVDIGKDHTSYCIYEEWHPIYYGVLPIGGESVTKDISIGFQIDIKQAEKIKINYGQLLHPDAPLEQHSELDAAFLGQIITARYEEIFEKIQQQLIVLDKDGRLPWGIILTGGGAKINNIQLLTKQVCKIATFLGIDKHATAGELQTNLQFLNCFGSYQRAQKYTTNTSNIRNLSKQKDIISQFIKFIKNLF